jgi:hypothetical protein
MWASLCVGQRVLVKREQDKRCSSRDILGRPVNHQMIRKHTYGGTPAEKAKRARLRGLLNTARREPLEASRPRWVLED